MSTNILISLDKRRAKQNGSYPLVLRISHQRRTANIQLGYNIRDKDWDEKRRQVKKSYSGVTSITRLNHRLTKIQAEAFEKVRELEEKGLLAELNATDIKNHLIEKVTPSSFLDYNLKLVADLRKIKKYGTADSYYAIWSILKKFIESQGKKDLSFKEVNYKFLVKLEQAHLQKGNSLNGLAVYMRTIRAIYNKAIKDSLAERNDYPFQEYKIKTEPTKKRAIPIEDLQKVLNLELESETNLFHYRNYFLASYFLWGISFIDLAFLKFDDINNGRIKYRRKKTGKLYDIRISQPLSEIVKYYSTGKASSDFIFPIIKRSLPEKQHHDVKWERKRYNKGLKKIAQLAGIEENLTSYVVRHSFATQALLNEIPIKAISEMLGHSDLSTTQVYLKSLPTNVLDEYADRLGLV